MRLEIRGGEERRRGKGKKGKRRGDVKSKGENEGRGKENKMTEQRNEGETYRRIREKESWDEKKSRKVCPYSSIVG